MSDPTNPPRGAPHFVARHQRGLLDFWTVYEAHYAELQKVTTELAEGHPEFGPLIRAMSPEQMAAQSQRSRDTLRRAIVDGEWEPYVADLYTQGSTYAKIGLSFKGWYELISPFQRWLVPRLIEAYGTAPEQLAGALTAMSEFIDYVMTVIGQQYLEEKEEARLRLLLESVRDYSIIMLDVGGNVTSWNAGAQALKGYSAPEIIGKHFSLFYSAEDRLAGHPERELQAALERGKYEEEGWRVRKDGSRFWADVVLRPVRSAAGAVLGFAKVTRDLTERKLADDELRLAKDAAEAANRELEAFSYSVAHDLRAPLRGINGFSRAIVEDCEHLLDAQAKDYLQRIAAGTERMGQLIDALLSLSRVTRAELRPQAVNLTQLARGILAQLRASSPERTIECDVEDGLVAHIDPLLARVLLENLLGNAWKFTENKPAARIELGCTRASDTATFSVRDNGAGFDMEYVDKLFAPFQRLHSTSEFAGTGIGLATVQRVIRRHGGRIWAEGTPGRGAAFHFTLPVAEGAHA